MGTSYNSSIVTDGLVLCLDAANPRSYPGSGTSWLDISGNGKYGTLNGPTFNSDNAGVINFDGTDDTCPTHISSQMTNTQNGSIETWVKFTNDTDLSSGNIQVYMIPCPNSLYLYFYRNAHWSSYAMSNFLYYRKASNGATGYSIPYSAYYYPNIWYQNVLTWDENGVQKTYQNGTQTRSDTVSDFDYWYAPNGSNFSISTNYTFEGDIAQLKMYNRTLSAQEIRQNYNATRGRYGN